MAHPSAWPSKTQWPRWALIPYLLLADLQNTALSAFFVFSDSALYPTYAAAPRLLGLSALDDQATNLGADFSQLRHQVRHIV